MSVNLSKDDQADRSIIAIKEKTTALFAGRAGIWDYDRSNDRLCYCLSAARAFGLPSDVRFSGLPLKYLAEVVHPEDRVIYLSHVDPILKGGGHISVTFRTDPSVGASRRLLVRGDVNLDDAGGDVHTSGIVVELPDDQEPLLGRNSPSEDRNAVSPRLLSAVDHILAARACLTEWDGSQTTTAPLIDMLLMALGRALAHEIELKGPM